MFDNFHCRDLSLLWLNSFLNILFFVVIVNGISFLISLSVSSLLTHKKATGAHRLSLAHALPITKMPNRNVGSAKGVVNEESKRRLVRLSTKPVPAKVEMKPRKAAGNDKLLDKSVQAKRKGGTKGKQAELANQEIKDLSTENVETK
nr:non-histone chromosomal protein HMG-14-like [Oryctolagus cuniculus]